MTFSSRSTQWLWAGVWSGVVVLLLLVGAVFHRPLLAAVGAETTGVATTVAPDLFSPPPTPEVEPPIGNALVGPAAITDDGALPQGDTIEARIAALDVETLRAAAADGLSLGYEVRDVETGDVLAQRAADVALIPASNTKFLTAVAVLAGLGDQTRFATTVVQPEPGRIVLVGGGDPLLASVPKPPGSHPQPASLEELAGLTAAALQAAGQTTVTLAYDASLFDEAWNQTWPENYRDQVTPISALWADEGRDADRVRSQDPALLAATTFAAQLTADGIAVEGAPVPGEAAGDELARVESLPVFVLVDQAMLTSNNSYTEVLGRLLAVATGHPATFAGAVAAIEEQLAAAGLWEDQAVLHDASGLSRQNLVPPSMLAAVVRHAVHEPNLSVVLGGLPVAGATGTLADRFSDPIASPARGIARAKTGTLSFVSTLAGTTVTADGRTAAYAFMVNGSADGWAARVWTEQGVGIVTACGCQ